MRLIDADELINDIKKNEEICIFNSIGEKEIHNEMAEYAIDQIEGAETVYCTVRLKELVEADKEGRCLMLPCKVGDTVYRVLYSCHNADHSEIKRCDECREECDIEKTIISFVVPDLDWIITNYYAFQNGIWKTTKEEAEKALEGLE